MKKPPEGGSEMLQTTATAIDVVDVEIGIFTGASISKGSSSRA
ncbi:hypothetical protein [Burkholderia ubonensis]|nr:hypothetical protein [Burkholderia ubonensis]